MKKVIKQALLNTGFLIFIFCILPTACLLLMMAVGLTFGRLEKLNEVTARISLATLALGIVLFWGIEMQGNKGGEN